GTPTSTFPEHLWDEHLWDTRALMGHPLLLSEVGVPFALQKWVSHSRHRSAHALAEVGVPFRCGCPFRASKVGVPFSFSFSFWQGRPGAHAIIARDFSFQYR